MFFEGGYLNRYFDTYFHISFSRSASWRKKRGGPARNATHSVAGGKKART